MTRKSVLAEAACDHCDKKITTNGEKVYGVYTYIWLSEIGEDLDEKVQTKEEPIQTIDLDLCYECYRDIEQTLQNEAKKS